MTKLEKKLIELGYKPSRYINYRYAKTVNEYGLELVFLLKDNNGDIDKHYLSLSYTLTNKQDIDNIQQAFNQLQQDLKELKEYEIH